MKYVAGLDIGSKSTKLVFLLGGKIAGHYVIPTGGNSRKAGEKMMEIGLADMQLSRDDIASLVATGYGRHSVESAKKISEISCQAKGIKHLFPEVEVIIDIGGQDFKVIKLKKNGMIHSFAMNDKCAAGTGRYLELMAGIFDMELNAFADAGDKTSDGIEISSVCAVFAETEVINHISRGEKEKMIISGIFHAVAKRVYSLANRFIGNNTSLVFTGGVALNSGVARALERVTNCNIQIPDKPQISAAFGAAITAEELIA